jgi:glycosyltransferase involved in cell wall biosynthesis
MPSQFESLSLVMLEAWTLGRPVLVNRLCSVTHAHIERSGGGLSYGSESEFETALLSILGDAGSAAEMGALGRNYVSEHYAWGKAEDRLLELVRSVLA